MKSLPLQTAEQINSLKPVYRWNYITQSWDFIVRFVVMGGQRVYSTRPWWVMP